MNEGAELATYATYTVVELPFSSTGRVGSCSVFSAFSRRLRSFRLSLASIAELGGVCEALDGSGEGDRSEAKSQPASHSMTYTRPG